MKRTEARRLIEKAIAARRNAYSPYYKVFVGAALLAEDGSIYNGCNVENASGSAVSCAEANALGAAVTDGARKFKGLAVVGFENRFLYPCGVCRQRLSEFLSPDCPVLVATLRGNYRTHAFSSLFPFRMELEKPLKESGRRILARTLRDKTASRDKSPKS